MTMIPTGYIKSVLGPRDPVLETILRRSLLDDHMPTIQVDDNAGRVLQVLTLLARPWHAIEIGTLFGYSTIYLARGLPEGGRLTTLELDADVAEIARRNLATAGLSDRVDIVVGDAATYLGQVEPASVGLIFIDANKKSYTQYLKLSFPLLQSGGLLIADDAFADGIFAADPAASEENERELQGIRAYTRAVSRSPRMFSAFVGTEHGLMISYKE